jgi:anti-sigma B factor antagonist
MEGLMAANPVVPSPPLQIRVHRSAEQIDVGCSGKLTSETSSLLKAEVKPLTTQTKRLVLDLGELQYMDSSGLGTVVGLYASARSHGCELRLVNLAPRVKELLRITKLISVFEPFGEHL